MNPKNPTEPFDDTDPDPWSDGTAALEAAMRKSRPGDELAELAADHRVDAFVPPRVLDRTFRNFDGETLCFTFVAFALVNATGAPWHVVGVFERETWTAGAFHTEDEAMNFAYDLE